MNLNEIMLFANNLALNPKPWYVLEINPISNMQLPILKQKRLNRSLLIIIDILQKPINNNFILLYCLYGLLIFYIEAIYSLLNITMLFSTKILLSECMSSRDFTMTMGGDRWRWYLLWEHIGY